MDEVAGAAPSVAGTGVEQLPQFLQKVDGELVLGPDPNPFPADRSVPAHCSSLVTGTAVRRPFQDGSYFDPDGPKGVLKFFTGLRHTQGPKAGEPFDLTPEQRWLLREAFGWMRPDGLRKFRIVFTEMGRGNGKSQMGAGVAGYLLLADQEMEPEVVGVAADKRMARKYCLDRLKSMIAANPALNNLVDIYRHEIRRKENSRWKGIYEATSAEATSAWGGAPHGIIFDEVHAQPNRELCDALETAMGKRAQPMMWGFTTAGWNRDSICWELHSITVELAKGAIEDVEFLGVIWAADEEDDWTDPAIWRKANPMMGEAFEEEFIATKCKKAKTTPAFQNTFRTMYLSQWVGQETAFLDMATYDGNDQSPLPPPAKRVAFGGLDLSSTIDLSAFTICTGDPQGKVEFHVQMYAPEEDIIERERRDKLPYRVWVSNGWLKLTPGKTIDQDVIKADIFQAMENWELRDVSYDRWNASKLVRELREEGVEMVEMGQGYASMSAPTKSLLQMIADGNGKFGGNGALRSQFAATQAVTDPAGNIKPDKSKSGSRIDGVVGCIMALDGLNRRGQEERKSAYDEGDDDVEATPARMWRRSAYEDDDEE